MSITTILVWLVVGGVIGWLASLIMKTDAQQGIMLNIIVGIIGAVIAGLLFGSGSNPLDITTILWSLLGAVILLGVVNLIRRGSVR
ncbi:GlsB/YeaQ/YmgE family stress response membrane protein [Sphingomicrobium nitratireducens]|uniref:GlsB/YeaQ/YmgE family stress response membrane protein n=1 Tax=Sphingomicrobium nitratireducens TaxID=2964666 RepID=UPI0022406B63|nr:GlsB/YeaQ/YmgE family stress response membrane protein [Sphingomicrobium nitratireducens]